MHNWAKIIVIQIDAPLLENINNTLGSFSIFPWQIQYRPGAAPDKAGQDQNLELWPEAGIMTGSWNYNQKLELWPGAGSITRASIMTGAGILRMWLDFLGPELALISEILLLPEIVFRPESRYHDKSWYYDRELEL